MRVRQLFLCGALVLVQAILGSTGFAQASDDRGYLQALLEDSLSGEGRVVVLQGFKGGLSSVATVDRITIADAKGIWVAVDKAELSWNRAALLKGEVVINRLVADQIILHRWPEQGAAGLAPETTAFTLPVLPVSVLLDDLRANKILLAEPILGQKVEATLTASAMLASGEGQVDIQLLRTDKGPEGRLSLKAGYQNENARLTVDFRAEEAANGLVASRLGVPGRPALGLVAQGSGPLSDFQARVDLSTGRGESRFGGEVVIQKAKTGGHRFSAKLAGDPAPIFLQQYAEFLGTEVVLQAEGSRAADGALTLGNLSLETGQMQVQGALSLDRLFHPLAMSLRLTIDDRGQGDVLLPGAADRPVRIQGAELALGFDQAKGQEWSIDGVLRGVDHPEGAVSRLVLAGGGKITQDADKATLADGTFALSVEGLAPKDTALGQALGSILIGDLRFEWSEPRGELRLNAISAEGDGFAAKGALTVGGVAGGTVVTGDLTIGAQDLSRFSALAGQSLSGKGDIGWSGKIDALTGAFDGALRLSGQNLSVGIARLDALLHKQSEIFVDARRDETGLLFRRLSVSSGGLTAEGSGVVQSDQVSLVAKLGLGSLGDLDPEWSGGVIGDVQVLGDVSDFDILAKGITQDLSFGPKDLAALTRGEGGFSTKVRVRKDRWQVVNLDILTPEFSAQVTGVENPGNGPVFDVTARLRNLAVVLPEFQGALTLNGRVEQTGAGVTLDLAAKGPGQIDARVSGQIDQGFNTDLVVRGSATAALVNPFIAPRNLSGVARFDLRLLGPLRSEGVTGTLAFADARLSDPALPFNLSQGDINLVLRSGRASIDGQAAITTGGTLSVKGDIGLQSPFDSQITATLGAGRLRDPKLYDILLDGTLTLSGGLASQPLLQGDLAVSTAEFQVPSTNLGVTNGLEGLVHIKEPGPVRETRRRAGILAGPDGSDAALGRSGGLRLDVAIKAPARVFLRGRGVDAELGGQIRLLGSSQDIRPEGGLTLIRGRLEILGKRLDLIEGVLKFEGALVPVIELQALAQGTTHSVAVTILGPVVDPKITFTATPDLPEEEVLAVLLFDRDVRNLSAFQALQLGSAIAQLSGRGGEGMIARLRKGAGLDDLDIRVDQSGNAEIAAGKYLSREVYSGVTVDQNGKTRVELNIDLNASTKLKAQLTGDGRSGFGVFVEKDY